MPVPTWLWQGFIANALWGIVALMVGTMIAYLAKSGSQWAVPSLYGLTAVVLVLLIVLVFRAPALIEAFKETHYYHLIETGTFNGR